MLIRVNEKYWVRADDIEKIFITAATQIGHPETNFSVCVTVNDEDYGSCFKTFKDAEKYATQLVEKINSEEWC